MDRDNSQDAGERQPLLDATTSESINGTEDNDHNTNNNHQKADKNISNYESIISRSIEDSTTPEASSLGRTLTWQHTFILVMSRVIGSGIFATPGAILRSVGSEGLALLVWALGAVLAAFGIAVALEYGCMLPRSGGQKVYLEFTYRRPRFLASILVAINAIFLGFTASNCVIFSQYILFVWKGGSNGNGELQKVVAAGTLVVVTLIHAITPKFGIKLQNVLGWAKIFIVIFMLFASLYVVLFRPPMRSPISPAEIITTSHLSWEQLWEGSSWDWAIIANALLKVFYSYSGMDNASNVLNEVKDPVRTFRSVTLTALFTSATIYFLINIAYFIVVPIEEIKQSGELVAALFFERIFDGNLGKIILPLAVALSAAGNVLVVMFAMSRLKQEIARQGILPFSDILSSTKPFNSPLGGLLLNFVPSLLVIILPPSGEVYSFILETEGYSGQIFSVLITVGIIWLRYTRPEIKRPFKVWISIAVLRLLFSIALLIAPLLPSKESLGRSVQLPAYAAVSIAIFLASILYWYIWTVLIPRLRNYNLEEQHARLADGTVVTKILRVARKQSENGQIA